MKILKIALIAVLATFTFACSAPQVSNAQADFCPTISQSEKADCAKQNGKITPVGRAQCLECIIEYVDSGKQCSNSDQCEGRCLTNKDLTPLSENNNGYCELNNNTFGCQQELTSNGIASHVLCID